MGTAGHEMFVSDPVSHSFKNRSARFALSECQQLDGPCLSNLKLADMMETGTP
jgi:hypothetical protein